MSVPGPYGVVLSFQTDTGQPLPIIESQSERFLVGEEGQAFRVVTAYHGPLPPGHCWKLSLYVDGALVQRRLLSPSQTAVIEGWLVGDSQIQPMQFTKPSLVQGPLLANPEAGKIKLAVECVVVVPTQPNIEPIVPVASQSSANEKFWKQGGLTTQAGPARTSERHVYLQTMPNTNLPEQAVTVSYGTAESLILRKVLRRDNPAHAAFFPPEQQEVDNDQKPIDLDEAADREARRKRQRENEQWEIACDLTSDDSEPVWSKKPRERPQGDSIDLQQLGEQGLDTEVEKGQGKEGVSDQESAPLEQSMQEQGQESAVKGENK